MNKEMVISSTPHETRVAILEDDQVVEVFIEREHSRGVVGNIYKGRVSKVLPGMQSAFVDLGLERDAFLYVTDVISPTEEALEEDEDVRPGNGGDDLGGRPEPPLVGTTAEVLVGDTAEVVLAEGTATELGAPNGAASEVLVAAPAAAAASATGARPQARGDRSVDRRSRERPERQPPSAKIEDLLKEGQEVVVQVVKEPLGTKGARITSHLSLPGTVPRLHADGRSHRRVAQDRVARRAAAASRDRAAVPRAVEPARAA